MMVQPEDVTVPSRIKATCVECEERRFFETKLPQTDPDRFVIGYGCVECGHTILLDLTPA